MTPLDDDEERVAAAIQERWIAVGHLPISELLGLRDGLYTRYDTVETLPWADEFPEVRALMGELRQAAQSAHDFESKLQTLVTGIELRDPLRPLYSALDGFRRGSTVVPSAPFVPWGYVPELFITPDGIDLRLDTPAGQLVLEVLPDGSDSYLAHIVGDDDDPIHVDLASQFYLDLLSEGAPEVMSVRKRLLDWLVTPSWQHRLDLLDETLGTAADGPERSAQMLWGISCDLRRPVVAMVKERGKRGQWRKPKTRRLRSMDWSTVEHRWTDRQLLEDIDDVRYTDGHRPIIHALECLVEHEHLVDAEDPTRPLRLLAYHPTIRVEAADDTLAVHVMFLGKTMDLRQLHGRMLQDDGSALRLAMSSYAPHRPRTPGPSDRVLLDVRDTYDDLFLWVDWSASFFPFLRALGISGQRYPKHTFERIRRIVERLGELLRVEWVASTASTRAALSRAVLTASPSTARGAVTINVAIEPHPGCGLFAPGNGSATVPGLDGHKLMWVERDFDQETDRVLHLRELLGADAFKTLGVFHEFELDSAEKLLPLIALAERDGNYELRWRSLEPLRVAKLGRLSLRLNSQLDWFGIHGEAQVDDGSVTLNALLQTVRQNRRFVRLDSKRFAEIDQELFERLRHVDAALRAEADDTQLQIGREGLLSISETLDALGPVQSDEELERFRREIESLRSWVPAPPRELNSVLRPYQREGFEWLARMGRLRLGCVLADDMGLGKTLQALAYIAVRERIGPTLIVAPTSVCENWVRECSRFTPRLRAIVYRGPSRARFLRDLAEDDLVVASYPLLVRDHELLSSVQWDSVVFDEAQYLKNPNAKTTRAAAALPSQHRVALTGTPIENHLGELWSLFRLLVPGLLGSHKRFNERFARPIHAGSRDAGFALSALIRPYILRRDKASVAAELPPREEIVVHVDLDATSKALYERVRAHAELHLTSNAKEKLGLEKRRFEVLSSLTKLRQVACSPALLDEADDRLSPKLSRVLDMLEMLVDEGRQVLVFSQFVRFLDLLQHELDGRTLPSLRLDGSTPGPKRQARIDAFQRGECPVFLISLKAGGTGLNLTAADTVIHLDPWWNPAAEQQANDRAHRIGQTKPVTVYKLVARGTVEDKILELQRRKKELLASALAGSTTAAALSVEEMAELFSWPCADGAGRHSSSARR
ncbi:MAG: DEAD/DEAH box helicase [Myxococcota bacterium]